MAVGRLVRLEDVARHAGVSLATASRALRNGDPSGRPDLRRRVLESAEVLGYVPNSHARALAGAQSDTVGLVVHDIGDFYFAMVAGGAIRVANTAGHLVSIQCTFQDPRQELRYVGLLRAQRARAIILAGTGFEDRAHTRAMSEELQGYLDAGGSVVSITRHRLPGDSVLIDNRLGAAELARRLHDLGHERFAVIAGPSRLLTVRDRVAGFRDGLASRGVDPSSIELVRTEFSREGGYRGTSQLSRSGTAATCVFAVSDAMAVGALAAARDAGLLVPRDLSIAGFGDVPLARDMVPALTTVHLPLERVGAEAMELALSQNLTGRHRTVVIGYEVQLRESTAGPRHK